uniref:Chromosome transmission fidelity protein 4 n=1 Tax=Kwoniella pini CBS 10737 TaxID=1296096 RepID=A0A1B9HVD7_9TREE|nr:chromosome transmission fidelity protein 4 [Kwoniella pini CBS 10737]OCF47235.1 chromosome transmission fidelity protein 4 [Kwoniella pini CBS 10737]
MVEADSSSITSIPCHLSGVTRVCFSPDGSTIFTGGSDCLVRIHKADQPDSEPGFHDNHTDAVTSLTCSKTNLITASEDNIARIFSYPENEFTGFLTRSSGVPIRWVSVDNSGERVAVCSDDLLSDQQHGIQITASCDGKLKVYDTTSDTPICLKIMEGVIGSSESESSVSCYAAWHPAGNYFAVPLRTNDIGIISREGWSKQTTFTHDGPKTSIGELAWSPNGKYLASSSNTTIYIWATDSRQVIAKYSNSEGAISGLCFSPKSNLIAYTSLDGSFHRWSNPIPDNLPNPYSTAREEAKNLDKLLDDEFGDDEVDMEDKGEDLDNDENDLFGDDGWIVDDEDGVKGAYGKDDDERKWSNGRTEVVNVTKAQASFTPGSTEFKSKKRYLAFNMIGVIDVTDQETHNVVNVEFHDKSTRRGYHFQDHNKYTMASLGEQGVVYASKAESNSPSSVYYRPYDSWASQSDWSITLPPGEDAIAVATGGGASAEGGLGSVIVATSNGYVRFLTASGLQRYIWRLGEDVVSMAAGRDKVIVVHREGGTSLDGCQNLRYSLMELDTFEILQEGRVPLPKKVTLKWLGFTSDGVPAIYDSAGLLSTLDRYRRPGQARWIPLLDTVSLRKEGKQEGYWPVGVTSTHFSCIILKGSEKEPWFPRPLIQEVEMHMPLLNMDNQQGKLEESLVRGHLVLSTLTDSVDPDIDYQIKEKEVSLDKEYLQLVQIACKADNLQRALDVARLMHNPGTIEAAAKVAAFYHLPGLQERIVAVKTEKERRKREKKNRPRAAEYTPSSLPIPPSTNGSASTSRGFTSDFAPRPGGSRRSFGGVNRDATPVNSAPKETYIPETPGEDDLNTPAPEDYVEEEQSVSPVAKRRKLDDDEFAVPQVKQKDDFPFPNSAPKNPFAKKAMGSNPFAKSSGGSKPLDQVKSTSFFDRVDDINLSGAPKVSAKPRNPVKVKGKDTNGLGKQTTLFGAGVTKQRPPPAPLPKSTTDSFVSTETEGDYEVTQLEEDEETVESRPGILEESNVQETLSPGEMEVE